MIINSQFFITYYTGKEPLKLKEVPASLQPGSAQRVEYDRFIQSIDTIYGSQKLDGTIPKFWTQRTQIVDALGNAQYYYIPHPDSDLTQLDSKSAYYFIVREDSAIPLRIPAIGGLLLGFTDARVLPVVAPSSVMGTGLTSQYKYAFAPKIENLQPYEEYKYEFKTVSSNWPVSINNISGIIKPASSTTTLDAVIGFCPNTGNCDTNVLPYQLPPVCSLSSSNEKSITMQLSISPVSYEGPEVLSNQFTIECKDCLPKAAVSIVGPEITEIKESEDDNADLPNYPFSLSFSNLEIEKTYNYTINVVKADWPVVFAAPNSGTIKLRSSTDIPFIGGKIVFCPTTGLCPPNQNGVPNYSVPNYPKFLTGSAIYSVILQASLTKTDCDSETIYSKPINIRYIN